MRQAELCRTRDQTRTKTTKEHEQASSNMPMTQVTRKFDWTKHHHYWQNLVKEEEKYNRKKVTWMRMKMMKCELQRERSKVQSNHPYKQWQLRQNVRMYESHEWKGLRQVLCFASLVSFSLQVLWWDWPEEKKALLIKLGPESSNIEWLTGLQRQGKAVQWVDKQPGMRRQTWIAQNSTRIEPNSKHIVSSEAISAHTPSSTHRHSSHDRFMQNTPHKLVCWLHSSTMHIAQLHWRSWIAAKRAEIQLDRFLPHRFAEWPPCRARWSEIKTDFVLDNFLHRALTLYLFYCILIRCALFICQFFSLFVISFNYFCDHRHSDPSSLPFSSMSSRITPGEASLTVGTLPNNTYALTNYVSHRNTSVFLSNHCCFEYGLLNLLWIDVLFSNTAYGLL